MSKDNQLDIEKVVVEDVDPAFDAGQPLQPRAIVVDFSELDEDEVVTEDDVRSEPEPVPAKDEDQDGDQDEPVEAPRREEKPAARG